jgi:hypothetical protein
MDSKRETIKQLHALLPCKQFVVTGSTALQFLGLVESSSDLDIILVDASEETKNICVRLQNDCPAKSKPEGGEVVYIFMYNNIKVDIFLLNKEIPTELKVDGFLVADLKTIVSAKMRFARTKDWVQLRKLSRFFFKQEKFDEYVDSKGYSSSQDFEDYEAERNGGKPERSR